MTRTMRQVGLLGLVAFLLMASGCRQVSPVMSRSDVSQSNERRVADALNRIARAEYLWRQRDMDGDGVLNFYVADLAFLEAQPGGRAKPEFHLPEGIARADVGRYGSEAVPFHGYLFQAMSRNGDGVPLVNAQRFQFGFVAWPAAYRDSGVRTMIVNEVGAVWAKDHAGHPVSIWPTMGAQKHGWTEATMPGWSPTFPEEN